MKTLINLILDKSGSMSSVVGDTIGGFNSYIDQLSKDGNDYLFSLTMFDTEFHLVHNVKPLTEVPKLTEKTYVPGGCTALLDAIGHSVSKVQANGHGAEKVLTVIMTDGHENSSREHTLDQIKALIDRKEKEGNWTFVFLGATPDAWDIGASFGVHPGNTYRYDPSHITQVYANMARSSTAFAASRALRTSAFAGKQDFFDPANPPTIKNPIRPIRPTPRQYKSGIWRPKTTS